MSHTKLKIREDVAPCVDACPAHIDVPKYVRLISVGKFNDALSVIRERVPFPAVLGRVCTRPCEGACSARSPVTPAISIKMLKRFLGDSVRCDDDQCKDKIKNRSHQIAVIGAGPAGLTAAYNLAKYGYSVSVFEAESEAGGMLVWAIPDYRLPKSVVQYEISLIEKEGVRINLGQAIQKEEGLKDLLKNGYSAVFIATGAAKSRVLNIEGEGFAGVHTGLSLLRRAKSDHHFSIGKKVVVVGGGNVAIDAARTAVRLGADNVCILYRRTKEDMPAIEDEIALAEEECVEIMDQAVPVEILGENNVLNAVKCKKTCPGEPDDSGRRRPIIIDDSEFVIKADTVIKAIGEMPDADVWGPCKEKIQKVESASLETAIKGVFAGGDFLRGPGTVVEAVADGIKAADAIHQYVSGEVGNAEIIKADIADTGLSVLQGIPLRIERKEKELSVEERVAGFEEEIHGLDEGEAVTEATECLKCNLPVMIDESRCTGCFNCMIYCSLWNHGFYSPHESYIKITSNDDGCNLIHFLDDCVGCGICARICPFEALKKVCCVNDEEG